MTFERGLKTFGDALECLRKSKIEVAVALALSKASIKMAKIVNKRLGL